MPHKKQYHNLFKAISTVFAIAFFSGCGKLDNLDSDDFDFFGKNQKKDITDLRQYSESPMSDNPLVEFIVDKNEKLSRSYER